MEQEIAKLNSLHDMGGELELPLKLNKLHQQEEYTIDSCRQDQKDVLMYILKHVKDWYEATQSSDCMNIFKPLRMTLCGVAGSGKSTLVNTLVTLIRKITWKTNSVYVCGPTGSAAFNAGGETCHRLFNIPTKVVTSTPEGLTRKNLMTKLEDTIMLIVDERSMLSALTVGTMEAFCRQGAFKGTKSEQDWGGMPFIIFVGDDYQLPPIDEGAFYWQSQRTKKKRSPLEHELVVCGLEQFEIFGQNVMTLEQTKRVLPGQIQLQRTLNSVRGDSDQGITKTDAEHLISLHIDNLFEFSPQDIQHIKKDALYLFATVDAKNQHNQQALKEINTTDNPVALIKAQTRRFKDDLPARNIDHYDNERTPPITYLAQNAQVQLTGTNPCPKWGLYHGARGKVLDIVYHPDSHPPNDLPLYVLVDMPQYCGPSFIPSAPTVVPIAPIKVPCKKHKCCYRTYLPLRLAFAQTIHTFQGQNAGPVEEGQPPNAIQKIICDPGTRRFEGICVGLFYTLLSRITTFGDPNDKLSSAIYFTGSNMNTARVLNITRNEKGDMYAMAKRRQLYVEYLHQYKHGLDMNENEQVELLEWCKHMMAASEMQYKKKKITD